MKAGLCVQNNIIVVVPWLTSNCLAVLLETSTFVHLLSHRKVRTLLNSYIFWQNNYALIKWVTFSDLFLSHLCFHIFHGISSINGSGGYQHYPQYINYQYYLQIYSLFKFYCLYLETKSQAPSSAGQTVNYAVVRKLFRDQENLKLCNKILFINH